MELVDFQFLKISELSIVYQWNNLTAFKGKFSITTGTGGHDLEEESTKLIELDGTYRIYTYENSLFAFVRE